MEKYRDPIHGFIEVRPLETEIINTGAFQRLRNIKQLAMTHLVFHGAEHTRFGHSLGVMHLVSKAFRSAVQNSDNPFPDEKSEWYEQILRLIALTHDLGHAPFSHAAESVFPDGIAHEDYTEKIIKETEIADIIKKIGNEFIAKYGNDYDISADLICDIYAGRKAGDNNEFILLKSFMDSELDCDKMDYLLRDSMYCGVNYGVYDIDRLISSLVIFKEKEGNQKLAIDSGGIQVFEEFVLARYFMFVQVYFHRTRRYFDIMYAEALKKIFNNGKFPTDVKDYLEWDDCKVIQLMKQKSKGSNKIEECENIICRKVYPQILKTKTHPESGDINEYKLFRKILFDEIGEKFFIEDSSAEKMPHKIPIQTTIDDEKAIVIVEKNTNRLSTISEESPIIRTLTEKINIMRLYVKPENFEKANEIVKKYLKN